MDKILYHPHPILRKTAKKLKKLTNHRKERIFNMFELMFQSNGIGLAASQIGWNAKVFIANVSHNLNDNLIFINPEIIEKSGDLWECEEGCLSLPGITGIVEREQKVKIRAEDINGKIFEIDADGILARCILHEMDHLSGVLFIDRAKKIFRRSNSDL